MTKGKKQIAKPSKRQQGFDLGSQIRQLISSLAADVYDAVEKGLVTLPHPSGNPKLAAKIPAPCSSADIKASFTPEQLGAVEEFISVWLIEPELPPKMPEPPKPPRGKVPK